jgi:hypothetical protein
MNPDQPRVPAGSPEGGQFMPETGAVISSEIGRLQSLPQRTNIEQTHIPQAIKEAQAALPRAGEKAVDWAQRNNPWFNSPVARVHRPGFFEDIQKAGEKDYTKNP